MKYLAIALLFASSTQAIRMRQESVEGVEDKADQEKSSEAAVGEEADDSKAGEMTEDSSKFAEVPLVDNEIIQSLDKEQTEEIYKGMVALNEYFVENGLMTDGDINSFQFQKAQEMCENELEQYKKFFIEEIPLIFNEETEDQLFKNMCLINTNQREINRLLNLVAQDLDQLKQSEGTAGAESSEETEETAGAEASEETAGAEETEETEETEEKAGEEKDDEAEEAGEEKDNEAEKAGEEKEEEAGEDKEEKSGEELAQQDSNGCNGQQNGDQNGEDQNGQELAQQDCDCNGQQNGDDQNGQELAQRADIPCTACNGQQNGDQNGIELAQKACMACMAQ